MNFRSIGILGYVSFYLLATTPKRARLKKLRETDPIKANALAQESVSNAFRVILKITGSTIDVDGIENIPDRPCLYVCNHQSYFDVITMGTVIPGGVGFVSKDSISKVPGLGTWMDLIHCLSINRDDPKEGIRALLKGVDYINEGFPLFIFPEGTRSTDGTLGEFKGGSIKIAQKSKCPIVPMAITGTRDIFENNSRLTIKPGKIKMKIGKPIEIAKMPRAQQKLLLGELEETISNLLVNVEN